MHDASHSFRQKQHIDIEIKTSNFNTLVTDLKNRVKRNVTPLHSFKLQSNTDGERK